MIQQIIEFDHYLFRLINAIHSPFWDEIMFIFSNRFFWIPLYIIITTIIIKRYGIRAWLIVLVLLITIVLTDQLSVLIKDSVMRLRPSHNPIYDGIIHLNKGIKGGTYGFVSSHAANVAGFVTFLYIIPVFNRKVYWFLLLFWALLVSYSRIYNGVHYPLDVVGGNFLGIFVGISTSYTLKTLYLKKYLYKPKSL